LLLTTGIIGYLGTLGVTVMLARVLGSHGLGLWVIAFAAAQLVASFGLMGSDWMLVRQASYYHGIGDRERLRATIRFALVFGGISLAVLGGALSILAPLLARTVYHSPSATSLLRLAGPMGALLGFGNLMLYGTMAFKTMRSQALVRNLLQPACRLLFVGVAVVLWDSALAAFAALVAAEIVLLSVATRLLSRRISLTGTMKPIDRKALVRFGVPASTNRLAETSRTQIFPLLLGSLASVAASGVFQAARGVAIAPGSVVASMNQVYSPMAGDLYLQGRTEELSTLFKGIAKWSFAVSLPMFCLAVVFPKELLSIFGAGFRGAVVPLILISIGMLFQFGTGPVTVTLILIGHPKLAFADYLLVIAVEVGLAVWLIPGHGVAGAAVARMVGTMLNNIVPLAQVWSKARMQPYRRDFWKPIAAGVLAAVLARIVVSFSGLPIGVPAAAVAVSVLSLSYLGFLLLFRLPPEDKAAVQAILKRRSALTTETAT
jgi:O-antigen/teichoic acid export membrane protein